MKSLLFLVPFVFLSPLQGGTPGLPPGVVALVDGKPVTMKEYKDFLYLCLAQSRLGDLVEFKLLRKKARELGVALTPEEVRKEVSREVQRLLETQFHGNRELMVRNLRGRGFTFQEMRNWMAFDLEKRKLEERVVLATRKITEEQIRRKFEDMYGLGGVRVVIRQIQVALAPLLQEELRKGRSIDQVDRKALEKKALEKALRIRRRILQGEPFWKVCVEESDDPAARAAAGDPEKARKAGLVEGYNYQRFGGAFADAVRKLKPGQVSEPVPFKSGSEIVSYHIIKLDRRVVTRLEDVREKVIQALKKEPPTFFEKLKLRQALLHSPLVVTRNTLAAREKGTGEEKTGGEKK